MRWMFLIRYLIFSSFLINCGSISQKSIKENSEVTTFAFDSHRSGVIRVGHRRENYLKMMSSSPFWGRDALKHMPLYLKRRKEEFIVIFGTKNKTLRAVNPKTKEIVWEIELPGFLLVTPVYSKSKKIIYLLVNYSFPLHESYVLHQYHHHILGRNHDSKILLIPGQHVLWKTPCIKYLYIHHC